MAQPKPAYALFDAKGKTFADLHMLGHRKCTFVVSTSPRRDLLNDFKKHFCGTHFFNPPRYLRLLEIIPTPDTDRTVVEFLMDFGDRFLGKTTVLCKDTPAFIANRIGVFGMMAIMQVQAKMGLSVDEIDALTGPIIGRPRSATFRTADVVGLDTLVRVAKGVADNCPNDEARDQFNIPSWLDQMVAKNWLGDKTGQGFFKKTKTASHSIPIPAAKSKVFINSSLSATSKKTPIKIKDIPNKNRVNGFELLSENFIKY